MNKVLPVTLFVLLSFHAYGQDGALEEVIVSGIRSSDVQVPGVSLRKNGDFLLLRLKVINDTRDASKRRDEIYKTLKNAIKSAKSNSSIGLSLIEGDFVFPLNMSNYKVKLRRGKRPDTSEADISVKTKIPEDTKDANKLITILRSFVDKVSMAGRTEFVEQGSFDISVVAPNQYRQKIIDLSIAEINKITKGLGEDYRVIVDGLDRPVEWIPVGPIQVSLFIPYKYRVIPKNINTIFSDY